jgi:glycosyltransferase involved in cell wall biosynthesis
MNSTILIVTPTAGLFGGTERVLETLIQQADQNSSIAIAFLEDGPLVATAKSRDIPHRVIRRGRLRKVVQAGRVIVGLRRWIRELKPVCTLAWTDFAHIYSAPASLGLCPSLWWQRSNPEKNFIGVFCRRFPSSGAIANSKFTRDQMRNHGLSVVDTPLYPPFNANHFEKTSTSRELIREKLALPTDRFIIGNVGRLQSWKGFHTFVDAVGLIAQEYPQVLGLIVGARHELEPNYEDQLREHIIERKLEGNVHITGAKTNVAEWMLTMDVFAHTADREPFGIVVTEAMAMGLPVIASIPGGPAESVEDEKSGLLVQSGKPAELAIAMRRLIESNDLASGLAKNGIDRAYSFSSNGFLERLRCAVDDAREAVSKKQSRDFHRFFSCRLSPKAPWKM